jgi:hypothetical protein
MTFLFGFVIGTGFTLMGLLTMMLYAAAQVDQTVDLEFAATWRETEAAKTNGPRNVDPCKGAKIAAFTAIPDR